MALALGIDIGSVIFIDGEPLTVDSFVRERSIDIFYKNKEYTVIPAESTFIEPNVKVSCEFGKAVVVPRLTFEAPRSVEILRKELVDREALRDAIGNV